MFRKVDKEEKRGKKIVQKSNGVNMRIWSGDLSPAGFDVWADRSFGMSEN